MRITGSLTFYIVLLCLLASVQAMHAQSLEEFNGSYPSWANVKQRFGAKGDGKNDDTKAIQNAIDQLGVAVSQDKPFYTVLYLPAGTYNISSTLVLKGKIGVTIIGEDPATTTIKWIGADADTAFWANGSAFYKIARLAWDANGHKEMEAIGIHWKDRWNDGKTQSYASLNIEVSDNTFTGFKFCISGGTNPGAGTNNNDSEIAIKRCLFQNCSHTAIRTDGYNALDYWIWDCRFLGCPIAIGSEYGNFHAYRCYFKNSQYADVVNTNGYYKSLRGCYSEDSRAFVWDNGKSINPFKRIFQGNTVMRPKNLPIDFGHWGALCFFDNIFDKPADANIGSFVKTTSTITSLNNTYGSKSPVSFTEAGVSFNQLNDTYSASLTGTSTAFIQSQQKTAVLIKRQVFEVPPNADETIIQKIINTAAGLKGNKPVVHFAAGTYRTNKSLLIPAGADMQLTGDGPLNASIILPGANFQTGTAVIKVAGPANIVIRELQIGNFTNTKSGIDAIQFVNIDQAESRAFIDQLYAAGNNSIRGEGLDYLYIQKDNSFFADNDFISGGPLIQAGKGTAGIYGFGGQFAGISLQNNAKAVYKDCWWEGAARLPVNLSGSGRLTIDGAMMAPSKADSTTTVSIKKFNGNISLLNMYVQGAIEVAAENAALNLLLMNIHFSFTLDPLKFLTKNTLVKGVFTGLTTQCFNSSDPRCALIYKIAETTNHVAATKTFIPELVLDDRKAMPFRYEIKNPAASNILISRTSLGDMNNSIKFTK